MEPIKKALILGGGYAGVNAALRLRLRDKNVKITLVNERPHFVERIRNHEIAAGNGPRRMPLAKVLGPGIQFHAGRVKKIDATGRRVVVDDTSFEYDILIYALGSGAGKPGDLPAFTINSEEDATQLKMHLALQRQNGVVILGAGLTGLELAAELRESYPGRPITLVDRKPPGSHLNAKAQEYLKGVLRDMAIGFETHEGGLYSDTAQLQRWKKDAQFVVNCTGFMAPDLARLSGLRCDEKNRVYVNQHLRAEGYDNILVAGDSAHYEFGSEAIPYNGCATAMPMGTYAGETAARLLAGKAPGEFRYGFTFQCISLGRKKGIIQFLNARTGKAIGPVLTGKPAALFKELISRLTVLLPRLERKTLLPFYTWRKTRIQKRMSALASKAA